MKYRLVLSVLLLTGCATPPAWLASYFDHGDPCQTRPELARPPGYQMPNWCGAALGRRSIYNTADQRVGYIK